MTKRTLFQVLTLTAVLAMALAACAPAATPAPAPTQPPAAPAATQPPAAPPTEPPTAMPPEPTTEPAMPAVGSPEHPIKVLFVPSVDTGVIVSGGDIMKKALESSTGLSFEVSVPTSYAATIEAMCASPDDTIGFIPALGYVLANQRCGVEVGATAVRRGLSWYATMFLVARDSPYQTLADLNGKKWAFPDEASTSGYLYPFSELKDAGVTPGESLSAGGHPQAVLALYNGQADFATAFFSPPAVPEGQPAWKYGDNPEPYDLTKTPSEVKTDAAGKKTLWVDGYQILDARANVITDAPDIMEKTRILKLSSQIPNDSLSFSPDFDQALRDKIIQALIDFSKTPDWKNSIGSTDFYAWDGLEPQKDSFYDPVRSLIKNLGMTEKDILK
jgi:phosphonate transport system substrate-binding protein